jgi:PAS domain S-box-containing protein
VAIEGLLAGADDYITKPFSARELVARVGAQLELARMRRESQAVIERSEAFLRTAVEASGVGVWELDVRTNQLSLSDRAYELLGIEEDCEDVSAAATAHVHPEDRERLALAQARALDPQGDGRYQVEYRVRHPRGRMRWLDSRGRTTFDEREGERRPAVLRGAILDVSEQKRLLEVVRQAPNFVGVCGPDFTLDFVNEAGRRLIGQEGVDVSQVSIADCFQRGEQEMVRETVLPTVMREGQWIGELRLRHFGTGSLLPVECRMYANYADDGRFVGIAITATDISERKRAEATQVHFRALFESAPGLYLVLEPEEFRIVAVSDAYLQATMTKREEIMGQPLFEVFPDDPSDPMADGVRNLRASLERVRSQHLADVMAVQRYPVRQPASEGRTFEERWWSPINSPVRGPDGEIAYIIHRVEDVTPFIRQMQEEGNEATGLRQLESRAQHMEAEVVLRAQELQRVNEQLRASEERYRALLQTVLHTEHHVQGEITDNRNVPEHEILRYRSE